jgi:hypothetical protein
MKIQRNVRLGLCALGIISGAALLPAYRASAAITFGQVDTFQDGLTAGWSQGAASPNPSSVIAGGGPGGASDAYLQNVSVGGFGAGSKMVMFNTSQWAGDYGTAGVNRITADMANFGSSPLSMRVALQDGNFVDYSSTLAAVLPADGKWHPVVFDLTNAGLTSLGGADTLQQALANVSQLRLLSSAGPAFNGDALAGTLGVDNIRATSTPEPSSILFILGVIGAMPRRRRRM